MRYYVYILKSLLTGDLFAGTSANISQRVRDHNSGRVASTKGKGPWRLEYFERYNTREEARAREKYLKSGTGRTYLSRIMRSKSCLPVQGPVDR